MSARHVHVFEPVQVKTGILRRPRKALACSCGMTPELHLKLLSGELLDLEEAMRSKGIKVDETIRTMDPPR